MTLIACRAFVTVVVIRRGWHFFKNKFMIKVLASLDNISPTTFSLWKALYKISKSRTAPSGRKICVQESKKGRQKIMQIHFDCNAHAQGHCTHFIQTTNKMEQNIFKILFNHQEIHKTQNHLLYLNRNSLHYVIIMLKVMNPSFMIC
jgi:hypothetical protein